MIHLRSYFYPRSPCGERPDLNSAYGALDDFYPRSPCGERPRRTYQQGEKLTFLSTLSLRRATVMHALKLANAMLFLSTLSLRRATRCRAASSAAWTISIHALLAESDQMYVSAKILEQIFLSTLSLRRATAELNIRQIQKIISIHALLAESDSKSAQNSGALLRIWNKFYGDCIFMLTGKAVFYPFCPCFFHIFWCEGSGNFMIAFPSH